MIRRTAHGWFDWRERWLVAVLSCLLVAVAACSLRADSMPGAPGDVRVVLDVGLAETPILASLDRKADPGAWPFGSAGDGSDHALVPSQPQRLDAEAMPAAKGWPRIYGPHDTASGSAHGARAPPFSA